MVSLAQIQTLLTKEKSRDPRWFCTTPTPLSHGKTYVMLLQEIMLLLKVLLIKLHQPPSSVLHSLAIDDCRLQ